MENLAQNEYRVDYILTHTAPRKVVEEICKYIIPGEEELQLYLQCVSDKVTFKEWYFGHWHEDIDVKGKYHGLMENIVRLGEF